MEDAKKPGYWAVLPAIVRYDESLKPNAKLLYAEISALSNATGFCWSTNEYFAELFGLSAWTVSRLISQLEDKGYIHTEMAATAVGSERRIYAGIFGVSVDCGGIADFGNTPIAEKRKGGLADFGKQNNKNINNIPPISPQGGVRARKRKEPRDAPDWNPERFKGFWKFYPKAGRKDKQRAMDAWDKLQPSDELISTIARALVKQKASEEWQREIGIPYAATYLNNARWADADELDEPEEDSSGGWAEDEEVL